MRFEIPLNSYLIIFQIWQC